MDRCCCFLRFSAPLRLLLVICFVHSPEIRLCTVVSWHNTFGGGVLHLDCFALALVRLAIVCWDWAPLDVCCSYVGSFP